jgi:hypothetical protein
MFYMAKMADKMKMKMADMAADKACGMDGKKDPKLPKKAKTIYGETAKEQKKAK